MEKLGAGDPHRIGAYRLLARLGAGGMGQVYLARSDRGRTVAVKLVKRELAAREEFRARFRQEVQAARRVGGYWTTPVLDADTEAEVPWLATGYVAGPSLQQVVGTDHGALPERSVRILAAGLAHALKDIHAAGIVHRDLKPSNVLVTIDGPRVIDFGIARALETVTDGGGGLTRTGALIGSPGFMAPEQVRGDRITPACDVFCLGSVLAYAATGTLPFGDSDSGVHALMFRIAQEEPDLARVPEGIADLVRDCLKKDPGARPTLDRILERTGAEDTVSGGRSRDPWLPGVLVAQLGRHAVRLLDAEDPETADGSGTPGPQRGEAAPPAPPVPRALPPAPPVPRALPGAPAAPGLPPVPPNAPGAPGGQGTPPAPYGAPGAPAAPGSPGAPAVPPAPPGAQGGPVAAGAAGGPGVPAGFGPAAGPVGSPAGAWTEPRGASPEHAAVADGPGFPGGAPAPAPGAPPHRLPAAPGGQGAPPHPAYGPPSSSYGRPQPGHGGHGYGHPQAGAGHGPVHGGPGQGHGGLGPTLYGPPPPEPVRRNGRATAALVAVALVVALAAGGSVYALMNRGDDGAAGGDPTPAPVTSAPATTGPATGDPTPASSGPTSSAPSDGAVPQAYVGTWTAVIDNDGGRNTRVLTIGQGQVGDVVLSLTAEGPAGSGTYRCVFEAGLSEEPGADGPLAIGPSTVTTGEPASSCTPGGPTEITLLSDGSLRRVNTATGEELTYTRR
ncbi:protein kinase [Streptomyces sp. NPDC093094]|uniref:serine/threonine-protein kinase n=1 Tax=Streptomyces sp. NPDC093094 TaxID=3366026 RepID=UPI00380EAF60